MKSSVRLSWATLPLLCVALTALPQQAEAKTANGNGPCTTANAATVCTSGVCDTDGKCGYANGDGPCTSANAATVCRSGVGDKDGKCGYSNGDGPCTQNNAGTVCRSGVGDSDGKCGWANGDGQCNQNNAGTLCRCGFADNDGHCGYAAGDGQCTAANAATVCRTGDCSSVTSGHCVSCTAGASCTPANACHAGSLVCSSGTPVCQDTGANLGNGTSCGNNEVCDNGSCNACTQGASCTPSANPCHQGQTDCSSGVPVCDDLNGGQGQGNGWGGGDNWLPDGTSCGTNLVCDEGVCISCTQGAACTPWNVCDQGATDCSRGNPVCNDTGTPAPAGTSCGTNMVCTGKSCGDDDGHGDGYDNGYPSNCVACTAGAPCTPANVCDLGVITCSTGQPVCTDTGAPSPSATVCNGDELCAKGLCCAVTETNCGGSCANTSTDSRNCGACGTVCDPGSICAAGKCTCNSPDNVDCKGATNLGATSATGGGVCTNSNGDSANCSACGQACTGGQVCNGSGVCADDCVTSEHHCTAATSGNRVDGCYDFQTDSDNCGGCGIVCDIGATCSAGVCGCATIFNADCKGSTNEGARTATGGGVCTNTNKDSSNCGACGYACTGGQVCNGSGVCVDSCVTGQTHCTAASSGNRADGCFDLLTDAENCGACGVVCDTGSTCVSGACTCGGSDNADCSGTINEGATSATGGGACTNTRTDAANCGTCGTACAVGQVCDGTGHCADSCVSGQTHCATWGLPGASGTRADGCFDLKTDFYNCGGCGITCDTGSTCSGGVCVCAAAYNADCHGGTTLPAGDATGGGTCTNTNTDSSNCGTCGNPCTGGQVCNGYGQCADSCVTGQNHCSATASGTGADGCFDFQTDFDNCGACGVVCDPGSTCSAGKCTCASPDNADCTGPVNLGAATATGGGTCTNTKTDSTNCGSCGDNCTGGQVCNGAGVCADSCVTGQSHCSAAASGNHADGCYDFQTDFDNCGGCGIVCDIGSTCSNGVCNCAASFNADCNGGTNEGAATATGGGTCTNTNTDSSNCGTCGRVCTGGQVCNGGGVCADSCVTGQNHCTALTSGTHADGCFDLSTDAHNCGGCGIVCDIGATCSAGVCGCATSFNADCQGTTNEGAATATGGGVCTNTNTDSANCGTCGNACTGGQVCNGSGVCADACITGENHCTAANSGTHADGCYDLQSDSVNCGGCGIVCDIGSTCSGGLCGCATSYNADCKGATNEGAATATGGGVCTNTNSDSANCGACGNPCAVGQICSSGVCADSCVAGQYHCTAWSGPGSSGTHADGCFNLMTDFHNCGGCGIVCDLGSTCSGGQCQCGTSFTADCKGTTDLGAATATGGGICANNNTDSFNCGTCGTACTGGQVCNGSGVCADSCVTGQNHCTAGSGVGASGTHADGCFDFQTDFYNCGGCGITCDIGSTCSGGACVCGGAYNADCAGGTNLGATQATGGGLCTNTNTDSANCGACGTSCTGGQVCNGSGVCADSCVTGENHCTAGTSGTHTDGCFDLQADTNNCGACGTVCDTGSTCVAGACTCVSPDNADCSGLSDLGYTSATGGGTCTNTLSDFNNCGACGQACAVGQVCDGTGNCADSCVSTENFCDAACGPHQKCGPTKKGKKGPGISGNGVAGCYDFQSDYDNCGACGNVCDTGSTCVAGVCTCAGPNTADCSGSSTLSPAMGGGTCTNTSMDYNNCGACGVVCDTGSTCYEGTCTCASPNTADCSAGSTLSPATGGGTCTNTYTDYFNCGSCGTICASGQVCSGGTCVLSCQSGETNCGGQCVNTLTDNGNCGACGAPCAAGQLCQSGACVESCASAPVAFTACPSTGTATYCANLVDDANNCGGCGALCPLGQQCAGGNCSCPSTTPNACGTGPGAYCANEATDRNNCGACGNVCGAGQLCSAGSCVESCASPTSSCGTYCANLTDDRNNCGTCGRVCAAGEICNGSACTVSCLAPEADCSNLCVNEQTDPGNCGSCGHACAAGQLCSSGSCVESCGDSFTECGNAYCANLTDDRNNCGTCGNVCPAGDICSGSSCVLSCQSGETNCSGTCVSLQTSNANCGTCGHACASGQVCSAGACVESCSTGFTACSVSGANYCANLSDDVNNCGSCGNSCPLGQQCGGVSTCGANEVSFGGHCYYLNGSDGVCISGYTLASNAQLTAILAANPNAWQGLNYLTTISGNCCVVTSDATEEYGMQANCNSNGPFSADQPIVNGAGCNGANNHYTNQLTACVSSISCGCPSATPNACGSGSSAYCANEAADRNNCGACGNVCAAGQVCSSGVCAESCASGFTVCGSGSSAYCANTAADRNNCGTCGNVCAAGQLCQSGSCVETCGDSFTACSNAYCANLTDDRNNCGACGNVCAAGNVCSGSSCVLSCQSGETNCGGTCVSLQTNTANCGACGTPCALGQQCSAGVCGCPSATPSPCGVGPNAFCTNEQTDPKNCGTCGATCAAGTVCQSGACVESCATSPTLFTACPAVNPTYCANEQNDANNCGGCGTACPLGQQCASGHCGCPTATPNACGTGANALCTDEQTDPENCGACGTTCAAGKVCQSGACVESCATSPTLFTACPASPYTASYCANLQADSNNCGSCGYACPSGQVCSFGLCSPSCSTGVNPTVCCPAGQLACPGGSATGGAYCTTDASCLGHTSAVTPYCSSTTTDVANCGACGHECGAGQLCSGGACVESCASPTSSCTTYCANLTDDANNCGSCGNVCAAGQRCQSGSCVISCLGSEVNCGGLCVNEQTDKNNCGGCGITCDPGASCSGGLCGCPSGETDCNGTTAACSGKDCGGSYACTATAHDANNCGACGAACPVGEVCIGSGVCSVSCLASESNCSGLCVNEQTDRNNCGGCGIVCDTGASCTAGVCGCPGGDTDCNGTTTVGSGHSGGSYACTATASDSKNCGACGTACPVGEICNGAGVCAVSCTTGKTNCSGACVNENTDNSNCGGCGVTCDPGATCGSVTAGVCSCASGDTDCNGTTTAGSGHSGGSYACTATLSDSKNCGACGTACPQGEICSGGGCVLSCLTTESNCDGFCVNEQTDKNNCGGCGIVCDPGASCTAGVCGCANGAYDCNGTTTACSGDHCGGTYACTGGPTPQTYSVTSSAALIGLSPDCNSTAYADESGAYPLGSPYGFSWTDHNVGGRVTSVSLTFYQALSCSTSFGVSDARTTTFNGAAGPGFNENGSECTCTGFPVTTFTLSLPPAAYNAGGTNTFLVTNPAYLDGLQSVAGAFATVTVSYAGSDPNNCGGCGIACPGGQVCSDNVCVETCASGYTACPTANPSFCTNASSDSNNCGGCGTICGPGTLCSGGTCVADCYIGGTLYAAGQLGASTGNGACEVCTPSISTTAFQSVGAGTSCGSGEICTGTLATCAADCYIGGVLYSSGQLGAVSGGGACEVCTPSTSTSAFQAVGVGTNCGTGTICTGAVGSCSSDCYIGGTLYSSGQLDAATGNGACEVCTPTSSTSAFQTEPNGTGCGGSSICEGGSCEASCSAATENGNCNVSATNSGGTSGSCAAGFGAGSCSFSCTNGVWTQVSDTCAPAACTSATENGNCNVSATNSGGTSGSCAAGDGAGSCSYTCTNGVWTQNSDTCAPASCPAETTNNCVLTTTNSGNTDTGTCASGYSGSCSFSCTNGVWTQVTDTCASASSTPCVNYGGTAKTISANIQVCNTAVAWGAWNSSLIPAPWQVCTTNQWLEYAPSGSPSSYGLNTLWINNGSCLSGQGHQEVYVSYPMNDTACFDDSGTTCCWENTTQLEFAVCQP